MARRSARCSRSASRACGATSSSTAGWRGGRRGSPGVSTSPRSREAEMVGQVPVLFAAGGDVLAKYGTLVKRTWPADRHGEDVKETFTREIGRASWERV